MRYLTAILLTAIIFFSSCNSNHEYDIKSSEQYEKGKETIEQIEKKTPARFLTVSGTDKKNILGQTVIRGTIFNNAKMVHYKDIEIKLSFYSKTGTLLEEDHDTIYETINPGGSTNFKSKYFAPKGTDSVGLKVITAKF